MQQFARATYDVRNLNKHLVLDHIRFGRKDFTRVALARELGLSRAAISTIVNELMARGLVREAEQVTTSGGRPPI